MRVLAERNSIIFMLGTRQSLSAAGEVSEQKIVWPLDFLWLIHEVARALE
jgi:hypothetical protein